jgi:hypothetical protein
MTPSEAISTYDETDPQFFHRLLSAGKYRVSLTRTLSPVLRPINATIFSDYFLARQIDAPTGSLESSPLALEAVIPSQERVLGLIDGICKSLQLGVRVAARLVGVSVRRYHELRGNANLPLPKLLAAAGVADVLRRFYENEPELVAAFFAKSEGEAIELLVSGQYIDFATRLGDVRVERARELDAVPAAAEAAEMPTGDVLEQMRELLRSPAFERALSLLRHRTPAVSMTDKVWRLAAEADMAAAFAAIETGDPIGEIFAFLATLDLARRNGFRRRAQDFLDDLAHTYEGWDAFVSAESEAAFAAYEPFVADAVFGGGGVDEIQPVTENDVRFFQRLGIDIAKGRLITEAR